MQQLPNSTAVSGILSRNWISLQPSAQTLSLQVPPSVASPFLPLSEQLCSYLWTTPESFLGWPRTDPGSHFTPAPGCYQRGDTVLQCPIPAGVQPRCPMTHHRKSPFVSRTSRDCPAPLHLTGMAGALSLSKETTISRTEARQISYSNH